MKTLYISVSTLIVSAFLSLGPVIAGQSSSGYSELLEKAISGQLTENAKDSEGRPILITAIIYGTPEQVRELIDQGYSPDRSYKGLTAITFALSDACQPKKLNALIEGGAKVNSPEELSGSYPIHSAVQHSNTSCLDILLEHGAKPGVQDNLGQTPYFHAVDFSNQKALIRLWEAGADPSIKANNGLDVFHYAIISRKTELVRELLTKYHDANIPESSGS